MFGKWLLESLTRFPRNSFIPGICILLNVTFSYIGYRATKIKKKSIRLILYAIIKFDCSPYFDCFLYFELYFHTQWPLVLMLQSCYACYTTVYLCYSIFLFYPNLSRFSIGSLLPCLHFSGKKANSTYV